MLLFEANIIGNKQNKVTFYKNSSLCDWHIEVRQVFIFGIFPQKFINFCKSQSKFNFLIFKLNKIFFCISRVLVGIGKKIVDRPQISSDCRI